MKYIIIPYIALGLGLSLVIGIEYSCVGDGVGPTYYGSPFVFKQKSPALSMTYFYSISGIILNTFCWGVLLFLLRSIVLKIITMSGRNKIIYLVYKLAVVILVAFSSLNLALSSTVLGSGFEENSNYWYINIVKEEVRSGLTRKSKIIYFESRI